MLSAKSADSLVRMKDTLLGHLISPEGLNLSLADVATTLAQGRDHFDYRLAWVVSSITELAEALRRTNHTDIRHVTRETAGRDDHSFASNGNGQGNLSKLCESYLRGAQPGSNMVLRVNEGRRVHLPGYVFDTRAFWFESRHEPEAVKESAQSDDLFLLRATNGG
jgi:acyl transferase domain-containing protein